MGEDQPPGTTGTAVGTIIGTGYADLNRTHVFNPQWPPHARFHGAAGWGTDARSQLLALWPLWRPGQQPSERDLALNDRRVASRDLLGAVLSRLLYSGHRG